MFLICIMFISRINFESSGPVCSSPLHTHLCTSPGGVYHLQKASLSTFFFLPFSRKQPRRALLLAVMATSVLLLVINQAGVKSPFQQGWQQPNPPFPASYPSRQVRPSAVSVITIHHCLITCRTRDSQLVSSSKENWL